MHQKIVVENLSKRFKLYRRPADRLREWLGFGKRHTENWALRDISFEVAEGEVLGVIGPNGSGKSTLLKILTGVMYPTMGQAAADGFVVSLLELGTGFNQELSGRENIINSARLLEFGHNFVAEKMDAIIDFAEIAPHIDHPIKFYSSGMLVRLAFSIFANVEPDVFIIDEALSVGDIAFQQKCFRRMDELREKGCTMLFVSHDLDAVRRLCHRVMYLHDGESRAIGPTADVVDLYIASMVPGARSVDLAPRRVRETETAVEAGNNLERCSRIGTGALTIEQVELLNTSNAPSAVFSSGDGARILVSADVKEPIKHVTFGMLIYDRFGAVVFGTSSDMIDGRLYDFSAGTRVRYALDVRLDLQVGHYTIDVDVGAHDERGEPVPLDRVSHCGEFAISRLGGRAFHGVSPLECSHAIEVYEHASC